MQNMSFYLQRWEIVGTKAIYWSFYLYLNQCHLLYNLHSLQKVIHRRNRETTRRQIQLRDVEKDDKNASKLVARHFNLLNHSKQHMVVCGLSLHQGSTESRKTLEQKFIFQSSRYQWTLFIHFINSVDKTKLLSKVAASFAPLRALPHIDSTTDQVLKIYLSLTEEKRQHCAHDETKPYKTCLFLVLYSVEGDWRARHRKFRMSLWGRTR